VVIPDRAMRKMHPIKIEPWVAIFAKPEGLPKTVKCSAKVNVELFAPKI
jgi:hypothetical protein